MKKVVVVSDSHLKNDRLRKVLELHSDADYFLHCGDSELNKEEIEPFLTVLGNNDFADFPSELVITIEEIRFFICHSHLHFSYFNKYLPMIDKAKKLNCSHILFGHTHIYTDKIIDGIRLLNPGSLAYNRDLSKPSYMIIEVNKKELKVKRYEI